MKMSRCLPDGGRMKKWEKTGLNNVKYMTFGSAGMYMLISGRVSPRSISFISFHLHPSMKTGIS